MYLIRIICYSSGTLHMYTPEAAEAKLGILSAVLFLVPCAAFGEPEGLGRLGGSELGLEGVDLGIAAQIQVLKGGLK